VEPSPTGDVREVATFFPSQLIVIEWFLVNLLKETVTVRPTGPDVGDSDTRF